MRAVGAEVIEAIQQQAKSFDVEKERMRTVSADLIADMRKTVAEINAERDARLVAAKDAIAECAKQAMTELRKEYEKISISLATQQEQMKSMIDAIVEKASLKLDTNEQILRNFAENIKSGAEESAKSALASAERADMYATNIQEAASYIGKIKDMETQISEISDKISELNITMSRMAR